MFGSFFNVFQGTVILIFQPAEEAGNGAKRMIGDGAIEDVEAIFAVHVSHQHPTGVIGSRPGPLLAGCGFFKAIISGKEGRAGTPHRSVDPVLAASAAVISLQSIVSREANPLDSQVHICKHYLQTCCHLYLHFINSLVCLFNILKFSYIYIFSYSPQN